MGQSIDYNAQIQPIFDNSCMPCHSGNTPSSGLNLTSYENVMQGNDDGVVIIPFDYENSVLWQQISSGDMPNDWANDNLGISDLTNEEIQLISDWILDLGCAVVDCADEYECILGECVCINDSDGDEICDENEIYGCINELACNYEISATEDDGSCVFPGDYCEGITIENMLFDGILDENCACIPNETSIEETISRKKIMQIFNILGQESHINSKENILIYIYDDGTIQKVEYIK